MRTAKKATDVGLFIVIPGFNEEKRIGNVIRKLLSLGYGNVVFVDDGSSDASSRVAESGGATVLRHVINLGKGAAAKTGIEYSISRGAKAICLMDADGQHKPEDLPGMLRLLNDKNADIVFGYRRLDRNMPAIMKFGNWFINNATKIISGINLRDTQSGFRLFKAGIYRKIKWEANDYSMESEMIANVAKNGLKYAEYEIETIYLDHFKGTTIFDGIKIFINILKFRIFGGFK